MCCSSATTTRTTSILFWRSPLACAAAAGKCGQRHCLHHHHQTEVVIGVFCNTAIENAGADKELASIKQVYTKSNQVSTLKKIFYEIDSSGSDEVSIEDLEEAMRGGELKNFLESMGISTDDVWTPCILLDTDRSGTIDLEEFVTGCMQLHGPAKSMQLAQMRFENRGSRRILKQLQQDVHVMKSLMNANTATEHF
ncbi:unnamed protein product [Cladocopium goreaui]|uniref:Voltage-dependent calcium channel type A subunit alpha-1 n=1 Tax=Cladocopium goreaui TaxID=2562237 RepID=A0A9P1FWP5_9DINO|nr:unnamed protein product [Cladocopium goreaui]